jgi:hypothetical protein
MFDRPPRYRSYLLTLWEERGREGSAPAVWRFRLEDPRTGNQVGFASMDELFGYLQRQTGRVPGTDGGHEGGD